MRVFVAGATGVIGRTLLPVLARDGHDVVGMTRREERTSLIRALGAEPAVADAFDAERLRQAVIDARPDVKTFSEQLERNNRLRREGTRNLVQAALAAGARRIVAQSIAFAYKQQGSGLRVEDDPLALDEPDPWGDTVRAVAALEEGVLGGDGIDGVVLRYGYFYGPGTSYAPDGAQSQMIRKRRFPIVGDGGGVFSFIHLEDAAAATVRAIDHGAAGTYNIVDDEPAPASEWIPVLAQAIGAKKPWRVPAWLARVIAGEYAVRLMTQSEGASNLKARDELGLELRFPTWRRGFAEALG
jgi:nucleoside-diphosphate-sugar epimerase